MSEVGLLCEAPSARRYQWAVGADARRLLSLLSLDHCELSLVLTSDALIQELNRTFRGKDCATDVLSFPQLDGDGASPSLSPAAMPAPLGDVVISIETALRQARRLGVPLKERLRTLLIHGVLHLLGYDHEKSPAEARRMFAYERALAAKLSIDRRSPFRPSSVPLLPTTRRL